MRLRTLLLAAVAIVGLAPAASAEPVVAADFGSIWQDPGNPNARKLVQAALAQEGLSYCWGGGNADGPTTGSDTSKCGEKTGPGFDCSGLVHYAVNQAGLPVKDREANDYANELGTKVTNPMPGDLLFYDRQGNGHIEHVAIYLGTRDKSGTRWVIEAYGDEGWTAPDYTVRIREYHLGEEVLIKRVFTLQPKPSMSALTVADGSVALQWNDYQDEKGFTLTYGQTTVTLAANTTSRTITGLAPDSQVCFRLRAFTDYEISDWSTPACAWTRTLPAAATGVQATALDSTRIQVTWQDNATTETKYGVVTESGYIYLPANTTSHVWGGFEPGTRACFTVITYNSAGSATSPQACATTLSNGPATPSNLTAEVLDGNVVHLMWTDNAGDETGFLVRRRVGDYIDYATNITYPNATEDWVFDEPVGVDICYAVAATRGGSRSAWSNEACVRLS